jgi:two-component sensor histidine kinase
MSMVTVTSRPASDSFVPDWPFRSYLELGALPTAPSCARAHARLILTEWGLGELAEPAGLVVTELTTNAVQASAGLSGSDYLGIWSAGQPPVRLWLTSDRSRVLFQVWDASHRMPTRQDPGLESENGRGLLLVEALTSRWGAFTPERSGGKVVWAMLTA